MTVFVGTDYGRLLLAKIALFLAMLSLATINRLRLTPVFVHKIDAVTSQKALRNIQTNTVLEATIGVLIVGIVGLLGTMSPTS